jgi:hypothetical protein
MTLDWDKDDCVSCGEDEAACTCSNPVMDVRQKGRTQMTIDELTHDETQWYLSQAEDADSFYLAALVRRCYVAGIRAAADACPCDRSVECCSRCQETYRMAEACELDALAPCTCEARG